MLRDIPATEYSIIAGSSNPHLFYASGGRLPILSYKVGTVCGAQGGLHILSHHLCMFHTLEEYLRF